MSVGCDYLIFACTCICVCLLHATIQICIHLFIGCSNTKNAQGITHLSMQPKNKCMHICIVALLHAIDTQIYTHVHVTAKKNDHNQPTN